MNSGADRNGTLLAMRPRQETRMLTFADILFGVPLLIGVILVLGMSLGLTDLTGDASADAEVVAAPDEAGGTDTGISSLLGVGRVPLMVLLMLLTLLFGGTGLVALSPMRALFGSLGAWLSFATAVSVSLVGTRVLAHLFARLLPSVETYVSRKRDLVGLGGSVILSVRAHEAVVRVVDGGGAELRIRAFVEGPRLTAGDHVSIVAYEAEGDLFVVTKSSLD